MKGLEIDFVERTSRWATLGIAVVVVAAVAMAYRPLAPADRPDAVLRVVEPVASRPRAPTAPEGVQQALDVPWAVLFGAFESESGAGVVLSTLEPLPSEQSVRFEGEAASATKLDEYVQALEARGLRPLHLLRQQPMPDGERIRFSATAQWGRPSSPAMRTSERPGLAQPGDIKSLQAQWLAEARVAGLSVRGVEHEWQAVEDVQAAAMSFDAFGDYRGAREFVNRVMASSPGVALRKFSLRSAPATESTVPGSTSQLQARIDVVIFARAAAR